MLARAIALLVAFVVAGLLLCAGFFVHEQACAAAKLNAGASGNPYSQWENGPPRDPGFFPIAVWLQDPKNAPRYKAAGFNVYVGLWKGPTEKQLALLKQAQMPVICAQNDVGLKHKNDPTIIGWMHPDEPDNAQPIGGGKYGPPIPPESIVASYEKFRAADPTRPVLLNLGQGVAWDGWVGRGVRTNHPEDYPRYIAGCDIVSFDIYPVVSTRPQVTGKLWLVPFGVDRLRNWSRDEKIVWNCIECTRISNPNVKPTPRQVRAEVWMSLVHGSMGLIYFVHQFKPKFIEAGLFADPEMLRAVTRINEQIHTLAPVLNSPSTPGRATVASSNPRVPIDIMVKTHNGALYIFAVAMRDGQARATFSIPGVGENARAEVLGEGRTIAIANAQFSDRFENFDVHLYRIAQAQ